MVDLLAAHRHASNHRAEIEASKICGCFNCMQLFPPDEIVAWTGWEAGTLENLETAEGTTAICPRCGSESVIGDKSGLPVNPQFLNQMHEAWLQKTIMRKPRSKR
jgi:hypothetical protein